MALVKIARFLDLTEAQVVASALRSGGVHVLVQNEAIGRIDINLRYAVGGFQIWVPEADAPDSYAFIAAARRQPSTLKPLPVAEATFRTALSLVLTFLTGTVVPLRPRRPQRLDDSPEQG
jgi:hypothetical protein